MKNVWRDLSIIAPLFERISAACALNLNVDKCNILPMWNFSRDDCKRLLVESCPAFCDMNVLRHAMYLGFAVGIDARLIAWEKPLAKFTSRVCLLRNIKASLAGLIFLYNTVALSVLSHTAQLCEPTEAVIKTVSSNTLRIIRAPAYWVPYSLLTRISLFLPFRAQVYDFSTWCLAVRLRVIFKSYRRWSIPVEECLHSHISSVAIQAMPHSVFRKTYNYCLSSNIIDASGNFSSSDVNTSLSTLDSHFSVQAIFYKYLLHRDFPYSMYRQFVDKMRRWRISTSLPKQSSYLPPLMLLVNRTASI